MTMRIGTGYDVHRLVEGRKLIIGGVDIPHEKGLQGHSDADVLLHAVCDAILGAAGLGDIGKHFPDTDRRYKGISSLKLLGETVRLLGEKGFRVNNIDATIVAELPKMAPHIAAMTANIAAAVQVDASAVNVKATTTEGLGFAGRGEGIAAHAVCTITRGEMLVTKERGMNTIMKMAGLLLFASLLFLGAAARAQEGSGGLFTWTDKDGVVHMTDSLDKVPQEYRSRTQRTGNGASGGKGVPEAQSPTAPATSSQVGGSDAALKAQWQSRMLDAKRRLQNAENNYQQLVRRKSDLQAQWGSSGAALPPQDVLDQMKQLDADLSRAKVEIDNAREQINNVIPDEARRAGIPPGWLREVE